MIKGHLREHYDGETLAVGTHEMWELVCAQARSHSQPRDVVGVCIHLQRAVREVDDVLTVLTTVRDWEATMYPGVNDRDVTDILWHHGWGRRVFETLFLRGVQRETRGCHSPDRPGSTPWRENRTVEGWTAIINRLDVDAYRARLNAALRYRTRRDQPAAPAQVRLDGGANRQEKAAADPAAGPLRSARSAQPAGRAARGRCGGQGGAGRRLQAVLALHRAGPRARRLLQVQGGPASGTQAAAGRRGTPRPTAEAVAEARARAAVAGTHSAGRRRT